MRLDESQCEHQTLSLFGEAPQAAPRAFEITGTAEIYFDGGCLGNPGQKYGSFQIKLDGKEIMKRSRVDFGFGTNDHQQFNECKSGGLYRLTAWAVSFSYHLIKRNQWILNECWLDSNSVGPILTIGPQKLP